METVVIHLQGIQYHEPFYIDLSAAVKYSLYTFPY